jgi:hypothetical protein
MGVLVESTKHRKNERREQEKGRNKVRKELRTCASVS